MWYLYLITLPRTCCHFNLFLCGCQNRVSTVLGCMVFKDNASGKIPQYKCVHKAKTEINVKVLNLNTPVCTKRAYTKLFHLKKNSLQIVSLESMQKVLLWHVCTITNTCQCSLHRCSQLQQPGFTNPWHPFTDGGGTTRTVRLLVCSLGSSGSHYCWKRLLRLPRNSSLYVLQTLWIHILCHMLTVPESAYISQRHLVKKYFTERETADRHGKAINTGFFTKWSYGVNK